MNRSFAPPDSPTLDDIVEKQRFSPTAERTPPLAEAPIPLEEMPEWNFFYLNTCPPQRDPTIVWGTEVDCGNLQKYLRGLNETSDVLVTPAHVLVTATGRTLAEHPHFNRRILRRRVWDFRSFNVVMPFRSRATGDVNVMFIPDVDQQSPQSIAATAWRNSEVRAGETRGVPLPFYLSFPRWLLARLQPMHVWLINSVNLKLHGTNHRQRGASTMVNYLGHRGLAPLRSFKPSRLPYESVTLTVTMGATEERPVVEKGEVVVRPIAPLFIRADHRIVDATQIGTFAQTLREYLMHPERIAPLPDSPSTNGVPKANGSLVKKSAAVGYAGR